MLFLPGVKSSPSHIDIGLPKKFEQAGKILDILVLGHLILSPEGGFYSFADEGMMP